MYNGSCLNQHNKIASFQNDTEEKVAQASKFIHWNSNSKEKIAQLRLFKHGNSNLITLDHHQNSEKKRQHHTLITPHPYPQNNNLSPTQIYQDIGPRQNAIQRLLSESINRHKTLRMTQLSRL